eukprot:4946262-Prymnesium_polylepis.1
METTVTAEGRVEMGPSVPVFDTRKGCVTRAVPLRLLLRLLEQPQPRALLLLDRVVVHRLQLVARLEAAEHDLGDLVADVARARAQLAEGRE